MLLICKHTLVVCVCVFVISDLLIPVWGCAGVPMRCWEDTAARRRTGARMYTDGHWWNDVYGDSMDERADRADRRLGGMRSVVQQFTN